MAEAQAGVGPWESLRSDHRRTTRRVVVWSRDATRYAVGEAVAVVGDGAGWIRRGSAWQPSPPELATTEAHQTWCDAQLAAMGIVFLRPMGEQ